MRIGSQAAATYHRNFALLSSNTGSPMSAKSASHERQRITSPAQISSNGAIPSSLADQLAPIYGRQVDVQAERYGEALTRFRAFAGSGPAWLLRAPGRVNLIGEHTDYNHGFVMPIALDRDILLVVRPRKDRTVRLTNAEPEFEQSAFAASENVPHAQSGHWSNYVRGAAQMIARLAPDSFTGMDCLAVGAAPLGLARGSGLSSSSALTVAATLAFAHFAGLALPPEHFVQICSDAEWYVGTRGGIMDQFISLLARRDHALFLDCRPDADGQYATRHVPLPVAYQILIADSGVHHSNVRGEYNKRVASCRIGVTVLRSQRPGISRLRDLHDVPWDDLSSALPEEITAAEAAAAGLLDADIPGLSPADLLKVRACCRHVWHENHRVLHALAALQSGDLAAVGALLQAAHASARDDYDISTPELETLVEAAGLAPGVFGARLTGAGWGGCVLVLVRQEEAAHAARTIQERFRRAHGRIPAIFPCRTGAAAGLVATVDI